MKILIWIHKSEAISGNITNYTFTRPYQDRNDEWVQIQISQDEFVILEDTVNPTTLADSHMRERIVSSSDMKGGQIDERTTEWIKEQYNRNREFKDQIK
tara:strand:+ start:478 stop:774 length:297 start_codon:yes stop_codon:yes gene_type:complete